MIARDQEVDDIMLSSPANKNARTMDKTIQKSIEKNILNALELGKLEPSSIANQTTHVTT